MNARGKLSVLQVNKFGWPKGGSEKVFLGTMEYLKQRGHTVVPFTMKDDRNPASAYSRYHVENIEYGGLGLFGKARAALRALYSFEAKRKMRSLLEAAAPDIAHFHNFHHQISPSVFGPLKDRGVPIVMTVHDLKPMCPNYQMLTGGGICERCKGGKFFNCLVNRCVKGSLSMSVAATAEMYFHRLMGYHDDVDLYITPGGFMRDKMVEYGFGPERITVVPNFIDTDTFTPSGSDEGYALYCGRLTVEKGVRTLFKAAALCPDVKFVIAGSGPLEEECRREAVMARYRNVEFAGHVSGEDLTRLVSGCSFTVLPSELYENCPLSLLESLSAGKPVVGARIGGIPELVREGVDGLTFEPGNPDDLAGRVRYMHGLSAKKRAEMGLAGRNRILLEHSQDRYYGLLMDAYNTAITRRNGREASH